MDELRGERSRQPTILTLAEGRAQPFFSDRLAMRIAGDVFFHIARLSRRDDRPVVGSSIRLVRRANRPPNEES